MTLAWIRLEEMLLLLSHFSCVWLCVTRPHRRQPTRLPCPWDSPGKNTGVGCHFLLQCMKVKSENEVAQSCPTLSDPMDSSLPGSSIHGIFQARVLEWGAITFSERETIEGERREWKSWFKIQHSKNQDYVIWSHHFMANRETMATVADFILLGSQITVDGDCSHEIKRCTTNLDGI